MVGFDGWMCGTFIFVAFMCHNGSTSSTTSKLNCVGVRFADTTLKINFSSIWSNQKSKECCKRRKSRRIKIKPDWWLITFAVMWPNPNFNFYTLQHVDFKIKILQNVLLKKTINSHFITESILKCPNPGSPDSPSGLSLITQTRSIVW